MGAPGSGIFTATAAARAQGWPVSTYLGHENGDRAPSRRLAAKRYAKAFHVRWDWLLEGESAPSFAATMAPVLGYVGPAPRSSRSTIPRSARASTRSSFRRAHRPAQWP